MNSIGVDVKTNAGGVMVTHGNTPVNVQKAMYTSSLYDAPTWSADQISSTDHLDWDMDGAVHGSQVYGYIWYNQSTVVSAPAQLKISPTARAPNPYIAPTWHQPNTRPLPSTNTTPSSHYQWKRGWWVGVCGFAS